MGIVQETPNMRGTILWLLPLLITPLAQTFALTEEEISVQHLLKELKVQSDDLKTIKEELKDLKILTEELKDVETIKEELKDLQTLKDKLNNRDTHILFSVYSKSTELLEYGTYVDFDQSWVENGIPLSNGEFIAPVKGNYEFSFTGHTFYYTSYGCS